MDVIVMNINISVWRDLTGGLQPRWIVVIHSNGSLLFYQHFVTQWLLSLL